MTAACSLELAGEGEHLFPLQREKGALAPRTGSSEVHLEPVAVRARLSKGPSASCGPNSGLASTSLPHTGIDDEEEKAKSAMDVAGTWRQETFSSALVESWSLELKSGLEPGCSSVGRWCLNLLCHEADSCSNSFFKDPHA